MIDIIDIKTREDGKVLIIKNDIINLEIPIRIEEDCYNCIYNRTRFCLNHIDYSLPCTQLYSIFTDAEILPKHKQIIFDIDLEEYRAMIPILCRYLDNDSQIIKKKQIFKRRKY